MWLESNRAITCSRYSSSTCFVEQIKQEKNWLSLCHGPLPATCWHLISSITRWEYTFSLHFLIRPFNMSSFQFFFSHPTSTDITGPSRCGKTCFRFTCVKHSPIQPFPTRLLCFSMSGNRFMKGLSKSCLKLSSHMVSIMRYSRKLRPRKITWSSMLI